MSFCPLCRVPNTKEHKADGWHLHNAQLQVQGKMPMSKDLYDKFERKRLKKLRKKAAKAAKDAATSTTTSTATTPASTSTSNASTTKATATSTAQASKTTSTTQANKKNVNAWHWEERNCMAWAKTRILQLLTQTAVSVKGNGNLSVTNVTDIKGDAYFNMRKGKFRVGYEITIGKIHWEGEIKADDGTQVGSCKGTCAVSEFCEDAEDDDYDVTNFKLTDDEEEQDEAGEMLLAVMKKAGRGAIIEQLKLFAVEIHAKKNEMKA